MSSEALYEQYKDALKRGHVASLRGHVDEALLAYAEAARIAPERSTPHSSAGNALLRRKRPADALRHYEVALAMAPRDESALLGRAQALGALDRRGDAADAFDALAEVQAANGRLAEAVDAARRGLEMAEGRERRGILERLIARLRATEPDEPGRMALERALLVLEGPAVPRPKATHKPHVTASHSHGAPGSTASAEAATTAEATARSEAPPSVLREDASTAAPAARADRPPDHDTPAAPVGGDDVISRTESERGLSDAPAADAGAEAVADAGVQATAELETAATRRAPRFIAAGVTVADLIARVESAVDAGRSEQALDAMLDLAALHARDGRVEAALDTFYTALSLDPDSVALHLALADLYTRRGWDALANQKLELLDHLARLDGDEAVVAEIAGLRAGRA